MSKATVYNLDGKEKGKIDLPKEIFDVGWNPDLIHQVTVSMQANARRNIAHTKDRSEVRGGGKKPWRQKGTGRARHGSRRSPIWIGGGITFGPRKERKFDKKINRKMKTKALFSALSKKFGEGEVIFVDALSITEPKAKEAKMIISNLSGIKGFEDMSKKRNNAAFISISEKNENVKKSFSNFGNVEVDEVKNINVLDVMSYKYLVITNPKQSFEILLSKVNK